MATSSDTTRRWVATLIVLLLVLQAGQWLWRKYSQAQHVPQQQVELAVQQKIAASHAYDNALLHANRLLDQHDTAAAKLLLDSLQRVPTSGLFQIERQKLQAALQRLDSVYASSPRP